VEAPALGFEDAGAEDVPLGGVLGGGEAGDVAEDAERQLAGALGVVQRDVHAEAVVAPVNVRAEAVLL